MAGGADEAQFTDYDADMAAVKHDGMALQHVKDQTPKLCMAAVQQTGYALQFVKEQTRELCMAAVKKDGLALRDVKEKTSEMCMAAVNQYGHALQYVKAQTPELCMTAIKQIRSVPCRLSQCQCISLWRWPSGPKIAPFPCNMPLQYSVLRTTRLKSYEGTMTVWSGQSSKIVILFPLMIKLPLLEHAASSSPPASSPLMIAKAAAWNTATHTNNATAQMVIGSARTKKEAKK